jgi:hypothetical protein
MLHSHAIAPAQFVGPGLCYAKPLFGPPNRRYTRYVPFPYKTYSPPGGQDGEAAYNEFIRTHASVSVYVWRREGESGQGSPARWELITVYVKRGYLTDSNEKINGAESNIYMRETGSDSKNFEAKNKEGVKQWKVK